MHEQRAIFPAFCMYNQSLKPDRRKYLPLFSTRFLYNRFPEFEKIYP